MGCLWVSDGKYVQEAIEMNTRNLTVKNLDDETYSTLTHIRKVERRQLSAIIEDAVELYWAEHFEPTYAEAA